MIESKDKLSQLASLLAEQGVDTFILPTHDAFMSEYPPASAQRLAWLSGFDGSAGTLLVFREPLGGKQAALFTDGRYTLQAAQQLDASLFEVVDSGEQSPQGWLKQHWPDAVLGFDPWLHSHAQVERWKSIQIKALKQNPVDMLWAERPEEPCAAAFTHPLEYAGQSSANKRLRVLEKCDSNSDAVLLTLPDGIAWLLNIRGQDIPFNPLSLCYALLDRQGKVTLISQPRDWPKMEGVQHIAWNDFVASPDGFLKPYNSLQIDANVVVEAVWRAAERAGCQIITRPDPTMPLKSIKNEVEIAGMRQAHQRDGRALTHFLNWLGEQESFDELSAADKLEQCRSDESGELYRGASFNTISGTGPNGAIVHYRATEQSNRRIQQGELYLVDSGGQYPDGTTDVTRTVVHGAPSAEMIDRFTRVLKGHIALARAVFPQGTSGGQLDALARQHLWEIGEDYAHGTGHGVGSYLCVHEGPQRISKRGGDVPLQAGMILSNEPGYYKNGEYGIRIENLVLVVEAEKKNYLRFETLTLAPLDERLINQSMLNEAEKEWLVEYEARVQANMDRSALEG